MAEVNASIPLSAGAPAAPRGPDLGQSIVDAGNLVRMRQMNQQVEQQNALRDILSRPGAFDAMGIPTPDAMSKVMRVDPMTGMKLGQNALIDQQRRLQLDALKTRAVSDKASLMNETYAPILEAYERALQPGSGVSRQQAEAAAQSATTQATERLTKGGVLAPEEIQRLPTKFDPLDFRQRAMGYGQYQQWLKEQRIEREQKIADARAGTTTAVDNENNPIILRPNAPPGKPKAVYLDDSPVPPERLTGARKMGATGQKAEDVTVDGKRTQAVWTGDHWRDLNGQKIDGNVQRVGKAPSPETRKPEDVLINGQRGQAMWDPENRQWTTLKGEPIPGDVQRAGKVSGTDQLGLSPDAVNDEADYYNKTGVIRAGYSRADREAIQNRAAALRREEAGGAPTITTGDRVASAATIKADTGSLGTLSKQREAISAYERGAEKEFDLALSLIPKTPEPLNMQLLTNWVRRGERQFGDVPNAQFYTALTSALDEYAKVIGGGYGAASSTDSARNLALTMIPPGATTAQIKGVIKTIKDGMERKRDGYDEQIKIIQSRMTGRPSGVADRPSTDEAASRGAGPRAVTPGAKATAEQLRTLPRPKRAADAEKLEPGTPFIMPDGTIGVVPGGGPLPPPTSLAPPGPRATAPAPLPRTATPMPGRKSDLVKGTVYDTPNGFARWNGERFFLIGEE